MYVSRTVVPRPVLLERLGGPVRVTVVSAPAGSGKTVLLRSWLAQAGKDGRAAWVPAGRGERDPQRFWVSVASALRQTSGGAALVQPVTGAPDLDAWGLVERLLADMSPLDDQLWLVIDDVHELGAYVLEAAAWDALGEQAAADVALERALDLAEPDGALMPFLLAPPDLLDRHPRPGTAHASLVAAIRGMLTGGYASADVRQAVAAARAAQQQ